MNSNVLLGIVAFVLAVVVLCIPDGRTDEPSQIQCTTVTYMGNGRMVTCIQCYYPASNQIVTSNCVGG